MNNRMRRVFEQAKYNCRSCEWKRCKHGNMFECSTMSALPNEIIIDLFDKVEIKEAKLMDLRTNVYRLEKNLEQSNDKNHLMFRTIMKLLTLIPEEEILVNPYSDDWDMISYLKELIDGIKRSKSEIE